MSSELTTLVWERVCVCCGSGRRIERDGRLVCGGCRREIRPVDDARGSSIPREQIAALAMQAALREDIRC